MPPNRIASASVRNPINQLRSQKYDSGLEVNDHVLAEDQINGGLFTQYDSTDIDTKYLSGGFNFQVRNDRIRRRVGYTTFGTKPNSNAIAGLFNVKRFSGSYLFIRGTPTTLHYLNGSNAWVAFTGTPTLALSSIDRYRMCSYNDQFFVTTNGVHPILQLNLTTFTYAALGNAKQHRYVVGFHNRLVAANLMGSSQNPTEIAWSGILNFAEWNPVTDPSAGNQSLIESNNDYVDPITGLFPFTSQLLILRENSIWAANKQGSTAVPFQFYNRVPNIGCDVPSSACGTPTGLIWYNFRLGSVYSLEANGDLPEEISIPIKRLLQDSVIAPEYTSGSYNRSTNEYSLTCYNPNSQATTVFTFNFVTKSWSRQIYIRLNYMTDMDYPATRGTIDSLSGTINQLNGSIATLSLSSVNYARFFGTDQGDVYLEGDVDDDAGAVSTMDIQSKNHQNPTNNSFVNQLSIEYYAYRPGSFTVYYSKDGGNTFVLYKTVTIDSSLLRKRQVVAFKGLIRCRNYMWRLTSSTGSFDLLSYAIYTDAAGQVRTGN